jgi:FkbM family methyltransferase
MKSLYEVLVENKVPFKNGKIDLPDWVKRVNIDIGLSFDAPHMQNWIENDVNNDLMVFGFEANPFWVKYLTSEVKDNNFKDYNTCTRPLEYRHINKKCYIIPVALHNIDSPRMMDFYVPSISEMCGSLLRPHSHIMGDVVKHIQVPVYSLKDFFDLLPLEKIGCVDYIKVDVQGVDIHVLQGLGDEYLKNNVVYVTAEPEVMQYENAQANSTHNIVSYMAYNGFVQVSHPNTTDPTFLNPKFSNRKDTYIYQRW